MNNTKHPRRFLAALVAIVVLSSAAGAAEPAGHSQAIDDAMQQCIDRQEISGAITLVATRDRILHLGVVGQADIAAGKPMTADSMFWIASMTKPITATAVLMLQDEGKLSVDDLAGKYLPELADLKTPGGKPANITLKHLMTHTAGLAEATPTEFGGAHALADLVTIAAKKPMQFEPGSKWQYSQSGINALGRIVEVVSGQSFPQFLQARLFDPLGMKDTTFYPTEAQLARLAKPYKRVDGKLTEAAPRPGYDPRQPNRAPMANGGLFSTAGDYLRFCRMLLSGGTLEGRLYLKPQTVKLMTTIHTGDLKAGFLPGSGWGLACGIVREPQGVTATLSPGTFGHGGAYGTQAWIDPVKGVIYILMVQRSDFPNADGSEVKVGFQTAAAKLVEGGR